MGLSTFHSWCDWASGYLSANPAICINMRLCLDGRGYIISTDLPWPEKNPITKPGASCQTIVFLACHRLNANRNKNMNHILWITFIILLNSFVQMHKTGGFCMWAIITGRWCIWHPAVLSHGKLLLGFVFLFRQLLEVYASLHQSDTLQMFNYNSHQPQRQQWEL